MIQALILYCFQKNSRNSQGILLFFYPSNQLLYLYESIKQNEMFYLSAFIVICHYSTYNSLIELYLYIFAILIHNLVYHNAFWYIFTKRSLLWHRISPYFQV